MADIELQLRQDEARLVFLAVAYHLGRPGSELDPVTKLPVERGLADVSRDLQPQLRSATARISLGEHQMKRLLSGMLGAVSELKTYPMLELRVSGAESRRSSVPGFDGALRHLFPEVEEEPEACLEIAESMVMLKRRLDQKLAELPAPQSEAGPPAKRRGWWPFGR